MGRGEDRFAIGEAVRDAWFPDGGGLLLGARIGSDATALAARFGEPVRTGQGDEYPAALEDLEGKGRRCVVRVFARLGRIDVLDGRFYSDDRMDVDSAWRYVREHLEAAFGKPDKEVTGVLKLVFRHTGDVPARTTISRYKDDAGKNVLDVNTRLVDGAKLPPPDGARKLTSARQGGSPA